MLINNKHILPVKLRFAHLKYVMYLTINLVLFYLYTYKLMAYSG